MNFTDHDKQVDSSPYNMNRKKKITLVQLKDYDLNKALTMCVRLCFAEIL